jgi:hypothetical protein
LTSASVYDTNRLPTQRIQTKYGLAKLRRQDLVERFLPGIVQYLDLGIAHVTLLKAISICLQLTVSTAASASSFILVYMYTKVHYVLSLQTKDDVEEL